MYLKLDKKLILEIEEIEFTSKKSQVKNSSEDLLKNLSKLETALNFFTKIDIERFKIQDNEFTIVLNDKHLYLDNKYVNLAADLDINTNQIFLDVYSIYLKDLDLALIGKSKIDISKKVLNFFGSFKLDYVEGEINLQLNEQYFDFYVNTKKSIKSLKFLKKLFRLDEVAEAWMYDNVTGDIDLKYLYGKIDLLKKQALMDSIKGQATIKNAKIRFHEDVDVVNTELLTINYKDDTLAFDLKEPTFKENKIYGSKVFITDLSNETKGVVVVDLKTKSMLNNDILDILKAYEIKLPLLQKSGKLDSSLTLKIPYLASQEMLTSGTFLAQDAILKLNNFEFLAKKARVVLKDKDVIIQDSHMIIDEMLDANLDLTIDTKNLEAKGIAKLNNFEIKNKDESIVKFSKLQTPLVIDFKDTTKIDIEALKTKLDIKKEYIGILIEDLNLIYPNSSLLQNIDIKQGDLKVKLYDENLIKFDVNAKELNFPFEKDGKAIKELSAKGVISKDSTKIITNNSDIQIFMKDGKNTLLSLNNIDLVLNNTNEKSSTKFPNIDLKLKNSTVKLDNKHFYKAKHANISIKDSKVSFDGIVLDLALPILKDGKKVKSLDVQGKYVNGIFNVETKDKELKLKYDLFKEQITMDLKNYDLIYNSEQEAYNNKNSFYINGKNSDIIINKKHIAKANKYKFVFENHKTDIDLKYKNTSFKYTKNFAGQTSINAEGMNDEFLNALLGKQLIEDGLVSLYANGKDRIIKGNVFIKDSKIVDLAILNNLIILINTSPGLINPLLAIPSVVGMATNDGFNLNGYRVVEGKIDFSYDFNKKYLNMNKIKTKGNGIDFEGFTTIDFNSSKVDSKLNLVFFKDYSKIVGAIPVINYVLLGDKKRVDTQVIIYGTLDEPKYKTKLLEEGVTAPINVIKRIITSPIDLLKSTFNLDKEKEKKEKKE